MQTHTHTHTSHTTGRQDWWATGILLIHDTCKVRAPVWVCVVYKQTLANRLKMNRSERAYLYTNTRTACTHTRTHTFRCRQCERQRVDRSDPCCAIFSIIMYAFFLCENWFCGSRPVAESGFNSDSATLNRAFVCACPVIVNKPCAMRLHAREHRPPTGNEVNGMLVAVACWRHAGTTGDTNMMRQTRDMPTHANNSGH